MRLELSHYVESDLEAIADFIAEDSPARAVQFIREIWQKILQIGEQPCSIKCARTWVKMRA
jgi:plasmid stabilization system protein ParE